jgi:hypothetical protein
MTGRRSQPELSHRTRTAETAAKPLVTTVADRLDPDAAVNVLQLPRAGHQRLKQRLPIAYASARILVGQETPPEIESAIQDPRAHQSDPVCQIRE